MRVGILTLFHGNNNWGGDLQGYALKAYIEDNFKDANVDLIKYRSGVNVIYKSKFEQMEQYGPSEVIKKISERIVKRKTPADGLLKKRNELFEQFQNVRKPSVLAQLHAKQAERSAEPQKSLKRKSHDMEL